VIWYVSPTRLGNWFRRKLGFRLRHDRLCLFRLGIERLDTDGCRLCASRWEEDMSCRRAAIQALGGGE